VKFIVWWAAHQGNNWAWSKGQSFGSILADLERSEVVDLLHARLAKSLSSLNDQPKASRRGLATTAGTA
jgi:hypothetical protein